MHLLCNTLQQFSNLQGLSLGLLECYLTDLSGLYLKNMMNNMGFLDSLELILDENNQQNICQYIGEAIKHQNELKSLCFSFQDMQLNVKSFYQFCEGLRNKYRLNTLRLYLSNIKIEDAGMNYFFENLMQSQKIKILDLGLLNNNLEYIEQFKNFLNKQNYLKEIELNFEDKQININDCIQKIPKNNFETINFTLFRCKVNFIVLQDFLGKQIMDQTQVQNLKLILSKNDMKLNYQQQAIFSGVFLKFSNLKTFEINLSGCHLLDSFYENFTKALSQMKYLQKFIYIYNRAAIKQNQIQLLLTSFSHLNLLEHLQLEFDQTDLIEFNYQTFSEYYYSQNIYLQQLKYLELNLLSSGFKFQLMCFFLLLFTGNQQQQLKNMNSLCIFICNQTIIDEFLKQFANIISQCYPNLNEFTLTLDECRLEANQINILFNNLQLKQLRNIDLSFDENQSFSFDKLSKFIKANKNLQSIGISISKIKELVYNVDTLGIALSNLDLQTLHLKFNDCHVENIKQIEFLYKGMQQFKNMMHLSLFLNSIQQLDKHIYELSQALIVMNQLQILNLYLSNCGLRIEGMEQLFQSLSNKFLLISLDVSFDQNEINDYGGIYLGQSISYMKNLKILDISLQRCDMIPCVAEKLCLAIQELSKLKKLHLYLGDNHIGSFAPVNLSYSCQRLNRLTDLKLNFSESNIREQGLESLSKGLLYLKQLQKCELHLNNNDIQQNSLTQLGQFFKNNGSQMTYIYINLHNNQNITQDGLEGLMKGLGYVKSVKQLEISFQECQLSRQVMVKMPLCLDNKENLKILKIYIGQNQSGALMAKQFAEKLSNCINLKAFVLGGFENQFGNNGCVRLSQSIFSLPQIKNVVLGIQMNDINEKETIIQLAQNIRNCGSLKRIQVSIGENNNEFDKQISQGLYALADTNIQICQQLQTFQIINQQWKDRFSPFINPISKTFVTILQIIAAQYHIAPQLCYIFSYTLWDLYI